MTGDKVTCSPVTLRGTSATAEHLANQVPPAERLYKARAFTVPSWRGRCSKKDQPRFSVHPARSWYQTGQGLNATQHEVRQIWGALRKTALGPSFRPLLFKDLARS